MSVVESLTSASEGLFSLRSRQLSDGWVREAAVKSMRGLMWSTCSAGSITKSEVWSRCFLSDGGEVHSCRWVMYADRYRLVKISARGIVLLKVRWDRGVIVGSIGNPIVLQIKWKIRQHNPARE